MIIVNKRKIELIESDYVMWVVARKENDYTVLRIIDKQFFDLLYGNNIEFDISTEIANPDKSQVPFNCIKYYEIYFNNINFGYKTINKSISNTFNNFRSVIDIKATQFSIILLLVRKILKQHYIIKKDGSIHKLCEIVCYDSKNRIIILSLWNEQIELINYLRTNETILMISNPRVNVFRMEHTIEIHSESAIEVDVSNELIKEIKSNVIKRINWIEDKTKVVFAEKIKDIEFNEYNLEIFKECVIYIKCQIKIESFLNNIVVHQCDICKRIRTTDNLIFSCFFCNKKVEKNEYYFTLSKKIFILQNCENYGELITDHVVPRKIFRISEIDYLRMRYVQKKNLKNDFEKKMFTAKLRIFKKSNGVVKKFLEDIYFEA